MQVHGMGRLTADPELRYTQSGKAVVTFTLACNKGSGQNKTADFFNCQSWDKKAETIAKYCKKGDRINIVTARLSTRSYDNNAGQKVRVTEIIVDDFEFIEGAKRDQVPEQGAQAPKSQQGEMPFGGQQVGGQPNPFEAEEEIPF